MRFLSAFRRTILQSVNTRSAQRTARKPAAEDEKPHVFGPFHFELSLKVISECAAGLPAPFVDLPVHFAAATRVPAPAGDLSCLRRTFAARAAKLLAIGHSTRTRGMRTFICIGHDDLLDDFIFQSRRSHGRTKSLDA